MEAIFLEDEKSRQYFLQKSENKGMTVRVYQAIRPPSVGGGGGLYLQPPKFGHICSCHNFFPLSSVQILLIRACCLLCVL